MAKRKLREDKNCLNCGAHVKSRFCPECGQENIINRPGVWSLIGNFFEDLFTYDSRFWLTIHTLLFKPGKIIADFLEGKRKSYVPPVRLYIFASFLTFLASFILPDFSNNPEVNSHKANDKQEVKRQNTDSEYLGKPKSQKEKERTALFDSLYKLTQTKKKIDSLDYARLVKMAERLKEEDPVKTKIESSHDERITIGTTRVSLEEMDFSSGVDYNDHYTNMNTVKEFDSIHNSLSKADRLNPFMKAGVRKIVELKERSVKEQKSLGEAFLNTFTNTLPKALIFYLPVFALILWLFHGKKRWRYYDHAVFTLYYFSFLFVLILSSLVIKQIIYIPAAIFPSVEWISATVYSILSMAVIFYSIFYFYRSHRKIFEESFMMSGLKSTLILGINFWLLLFSFVLFLVIVAFLV